MSKNESGATETEATEKGNDNSMNLTCPLLVGQDGAVRGLTNVLRPLLCTTSTFLAHPLVIIGPPATGKTTYVNWLAQSVCRLVRNENFLVFEGSHHRTAETADLLFANGSNLAISLERAMSAAHDPMRRQTGVRAMVFLDDCHEAHPRVINGFRSLIEKGTIYPSKSDSNAIQTHGLLVVLVGNNAHHREDIKVIWHADDALYSRVEHAIFVFRTIPATNLEQALQMHARRKLDLDPAAELPSRIRTLVRNLCTTYDQRSGIRPCVNRLESHLLNPRPELMMSPTAAGSGITRRKRKQQKTVQNDDDDPSAYCSTTNGAKKFGKSRSPAEKEHGEKEQGEFSTRLRELVDKFVIPADMRRAEDRIKAMIQDPAINQELATGKYWNATVRKVTHDKLGLSKNTNYLRTALAGANLKLGGRYRQYVQSLVSPSSSSSSSAPSVTSFVPPASLATTPVPHAAVPAPIPALDGSDNVANPKK